ncbi:HNH endonuclease signature motif containing protein [Gordonia sinesedis]
MKLPDLVDPLTEHRVSGDASGRDVFAATRTLLVLRNLVDHQLSVHVAALDRLGVATQHGRSLRELLIVMGCAPVVAQRLLRIAGSLDDSSVSAGHAADGAMSAEHHDSVVRGMAHIDGRAVEPIDDEARRKCLTSLVAQVLSGASPAEVQQHARTLGNDLADASDGSVLPAAEDRRWNAVTVAQDEHGRVRVRADLDVVTGEKLSAALDDLSAPRPEPDGGRHARSVEQRRADALEQVLDVAARGGGLDGTGTATAPTTQVALTIPADTPSLAHLEFTGSVTQETARLLSCDATVTVMIVDGEEVPMGVGRQHRLFTPAMRKALHLRDRGCIKCGAPASWTHAHHMTHWADGGETCLDNGCLLCPGCHDDIHHHGWEVFLGHDRHPWLLPPETVDPRRRPIPAYHRRHPTLDDLPAAA